MSYYNTFLETYDAFQHLSLLSPDQQTSDIQKFGEGWNPAVINCDLRYEDFILGYSFPRTYFVQHKQGYPWLTVNKVLVDRMTEAYNNYGLYNKDAYIEFIFSNLVSIRVCVLGSPGARLTFNWYFYDYKTQTSTGVSSATSLYSYNIFVAMESIGTNFIMLPVVSHVVDSADPGYDWKEVDLAFTNESELFRLASDDEILFRYDDIDSMDLIQLFNQNNWTGVPDWFWADNKEDLNVDYPPTEDEEEEDEGGYGTFTDVNDFIDFPDAPTVSALSSGMVNIYAPDATAVQAFKSWLWSSNYATNVEKLQASPIENIIAFGFMPQQMTSSLGTIFIGNMDTQIPCNVVASQYVPVNCGSINVPEYYGSFLDYDAEYQIYLPYIGYMPMKADDFTRGSIEVKYWVDVLTGTCTAYVMCKGEHVLYSYTGNCFTEIPIASANYARMKQGQMSAVTNGVTSLMSNVVKGAMSGSSIGGGVGGAIGGAAGLVTAVPGLIDSKMQYDMQRPEYQRGGGLGGNTQFAMRTPYLIQTRLKTKYPDKYNAYKGQPSKSYKKLGSLRGFTSIDTVIADSLITCTEKEKEEIIRLLKEGVIL